MEEKRLIRESSSFVGFNRKRAEGRDRSAFPKELLLNSKSRKLNPINTSSYLQILGIGMDTQDTSPSILLFFDKQRFIFNAGEGLQRFCIEHKIKLSKIDHIFLSRVCSETAGGLPGLLLTLAGIGEGMSANIWGPPNLKYLVDAMKSFVPNAAMGHAHCFGPPPVSDGVAVHNTWKYDDPLVLIDDEVIKMSAILLRPNCSESYISVIYVLELPEIKGKFDPKKADDLGLIPGPKYGELQLGNSVMSDRHNIMVHPSDVLGPSTPGPIAILIDCPTSSHLQELLLVKSLRSYYEDMSDNQEGGSKTVNCVIHLSPASLVNTGDYRKWMSRFGGAQHIMAGHETKKTEVPILESSARIAARLNYLCPQFFPAPGFGSIQSPKRPASGLTVSSEGTVEKHCERVSAENLLKFYLRPIAQLGLDRSSIPTVSAPSEIVDELLSEIPEIEEAAQRVALLLHGGNETREEMASVKDNEIMNKDVQLDENALPSCLKDINREDTEIVFLGTGSAQPSKHRNVSSIFINLFSKGSLLLDCGEGTLSQLIRRFGMKGADDAVRGLRFIWISHIHGDHQIGLIRLLAQRRKLLKGTAHEPLIVIGPWPLKRFLDSYIIEDLDLLFLDCRHTTEDSLDTFQSNQQRSTPQSSSDFEIINGYAGSETSINIPTLKKLKKILGEAGLEALISFPVMHCPQAFGVALKAADRISTVGETIPGWKIVYSGDTRPCLNIIKASHGATATFEDGLLEEAIAKNHSTTTEAIEAGEAAGAYRVILTHFSQRYPKIPVFDETHMYNTCIAFDLMSVNLADLHVLPKVLPYLKLLFKNEMIVDEPDDMIIVTEID
ncbi:hypothetical protein LguiB_023231 [Lonicera macranthoides]